jgi:hypothetical protein
MTSQSQDKNRQEQNTAKDSAAVDAVKTQQHVDADADKRTAEEKARKAHRSDQSDAGSAIDRPKRG